MARAVNVAKAWAQQTSSPTTTCVVAPTLALRDNVEDAFRRDGLSTHVIDANTTLQHVSVVRFATMHRAKGLEFDQVLVVASEHFLGPVDRTADERRLL